MNQNDRFMADFDVDYLKSRLNYNSETGDFTWLQNRKSTEVGKIAGTKTSSSVRIYLNGKIYMAHRLAWLYMTGEWPKMLIDHKNLNPLDNRWTNLREADYRQNGMNTGIRIDNTSGYKGVAWDRRVGKWRADIRLKGYRKHLGMFDDPSVAGEAYKAAADKYFGEFGRSS